MNASAYSALLKKFFDDQENAIPTEVPVREPDGSVAPLPPEIASATEAAVKEPAPLAAPEAPAVAKPEEPTPGKTLADWYGVDMADAAPTPRHSNRMVLPSAISRAGSQLGAALAGVKPDTSAGDLLYKEGASEAAALDKSADDLTNFKRQLMLRADGAKRGVGGKKYNDDLANPNSGAWKAFDIAMESTESTRGPWQKFKKDAIANGITPDANYFDVKISTGISGDTSRYNAEQGRVATGQRQEKSFEHAKEMEGLRFGNRVTLLGLQEEFKQLADARDANVPGYAPKAGATPTKEDGGKLKISNAKHEKVKYLLSEMREYLKENPDAFDKANPFSDEKSELSVLYGKLRDAYRIAEEFGVPSGNDMAMIADVVKDPRKFLNIFSGRDEPGYKKLLDLTTKEKDIFADSLGYVAGSGAETPEDRVQRRIRGTLGNVAPNAPAAGPASAQPVVNSKTTPGGKPYAFKAKKKGTDTIEYFDAEGKKVE